MEAQKNHTNEIIHMIYNDDVRVIDFLADMKDREPLYALERFVKWGNHESICLLFNAPIDNIVVLILYKHALPFNEGDNRLMVYASATLDGLTAYFRQWFAAINVNNEFYEPVKEITRLLFDQWVENNDNTATLDRVG